MSLTSRVVAMLVLAAVAPVTASAGPANLAGSLSSMERQHEEAVAHDYGFHSTPAAVLASVEAGWLERVTGGTSLVLANVSFPFARPEVRMFVEHLAARYHAALGEPLVITSLTRPTALQPANAHELSVHPAGMAVDFRVPARAKARKWLEAALLELERDSILDVTRERVPPHYHVAVFPDAFRAYVARVERSVDTAHVAVPSPVAAVAVVPVATVTKDRSTTPAVQPEHSLTHDRSLALAMMAPIVGIVTVRRRRAKSRGE